MGSQFRLSNYLPVLLLFVGVGLFLTKCISDDKRESAGETVQQLEKPDFSAFAGSKTCGGCHKDIYSTHLQTAHFNTSANASQDNVLGSFEKGKNRYNYTPALYIMMEKTDSGLYQEVYFHGEKKRAFRFDITTGSGAKGQTYLYWEGNKLFQLPISFFSAASQWSVSPGFPPDKVLFDKPITSRCLECHATFATVTSLPEAKQEEYNKAQLILGVDCEKCHGPGAAHVKAHEENKEDTSGKHIIDPASFSRQQKLDMCVLCHGGSMKKTEPSFSFMPGKPLTDFFIPDTTSLHADNVDVHGNQFGLLKKSPCFLRSETMTCTTCHDPHKKERENLVLYSSRCMNCHNEQHGNFCRVKPMPANIRVNCIDCHMPKRPSRAVTLFEEGKDVPTAAMIRTHFISVYPSEKMGLRSVVD